MNILKQQIRKASVESATHVEIFKDISSGEIGYVNKNGQFISFSGSAISQNILDALYSSNSPDASNYFVTLADLSGSGGTTITVVANYSALPDPTTVSQDFYWVSNTQGTRWLPGSLGGTFYNSGLYYSNGVSWEYLEVPYQATQAEVNAGTNTDKFVTPATLSASIQWDTKADVAHTHVSSEVTDFQLSVTNNTDVAANTSARHVHSNSAALDAVSGVNTGDQTSINGITGTKVQFNAAVTDGDVLFVGDIIQYTDEEAQDAIGTILTDSSTVDFTYDDVANIITAIVTDNSISNTKLTQIPSLTIKGNNTGSPANVIDLTVAQVKAMLNLAGINTGDQTILLTGDITGSGTGSFSTTIGNNAVSNTKLEDMPANTVKGNNTGIAADPTDLTVTQLTAMLNLVTASLKGLMSASDKAKLDGIAINANNYVHPNHTGDATSTGDGVTTVVRINGVTLSGLSTGILKNTTGTGVPSIATATDISDTFGSQPNALFYATPSALAGVPTLRSLVASDIPVLNQNTTGNAGTVTTINGKLANGTNVTITGAGTSADPYIINATGGGGGSGLTHPQTMSRVSMGF